jgi:hypothetical protein
MLDSDAFPKTRQEEFQFSSTTPLPTPDIGHTVDNFGTMAVMGTVNTVPAKTGTKGSGPTRRPNGSGIVKGGGTCT